MSLGDKWNTFKYSSSEALGRITNNGVYDKIHSTLFGVNVGEDAELQSVKSFRSVRSTAPSPRERSAIKQLPEDRIGIDDLTRGKEDDYENIENSRNLVVSASTLFRKGPIPIESLSHQEQIRLSSLGCLKEWDDSDKATSDNDLGYEDPSSKSLLSYFSRLGTGEDDKECVNLAFVDSLLKAGATFNYPDVYGQSIFFAVIRDWHTDVALFAIHRGADVNHADKYGRTPLHLAAAINYGEMMEVLINHGANIDALTYGEEQNPLHYATRFNAVEPIKILIQNGALIDTIDFMERTPLQLAAEIGSEESVKFLLKLGAPTGVYDSYGCSAVQMMIEKMPMLAYEGLNQFYVEDHAMRRRYYYLDQLENDVKSRAGCKYARNVLQAIVQYQEHDLIMHPAIQKLLDVKWELFGKRHAIISNLVNIFYTLLATILTYSIPFADYDKQFIPLKSKAWKIALAAMFFVLTFYFWIKQILSVRRMGLRDKNYKDFRLMAVRKQFPYCHPRWGEEKEYYDQEVSRILKYKSAFWQDYWNIFEWVSLLFILVMFALHITNVIIPSQNIFKAAKLISAISLLLVWFRLYKTLRVIKIFSELTVLLGHVLAETCKFILLFIDFYIPYVFLFFMLFGGSESEAGKTKLKKDHEMKTVADVAYHVWILTVRASYPKEPIDHVDAHVAEVAVGSYFALMALLLLSIYIGRMSEVFCRLYRRANSNANLLIASIMINVEYNLSFKKSKHLRRYMRHNCGPMVVSVEGSTKNEDDRQNVNIGVDNVTNMVEELTNFLGKVSFLKEDKQPINTDHLTVVNNEVQKLSQRHAEMELEVETAKSKILLSQKKTLDMIKEAIESRSSKTTRARGGGGEEGGETNDQQ